VCRVIVAQEKQKQQRTRRMRARNASGSVEAQPHNRNGGMTMTNLTHISHGARVAAVRLAVRNIRVMDPAAFACTSPLRQLHVGSFSPPAG
jgi:hypothetical protein